MSEQRDPRNRDRGADGGPGGAARAGGTPHRPKTLNSADMFAGGDEVIIEHKGAQYRLRQTSQGKLILTK